jgi:hypothetical protein
MPHARRYLEIGVEMGYTLEDIEVDVRWGVDPAPRFDTSRLPTGVQFFHGTSDQFFEQVDGEVAFDVAFLDGLHTFEQTHRDLLNALAHIDHGAVLIDDTVPADEDSANPDWQGLLARRAELGLESGLWYGDVWKLVVCIDRCYPELDFRTIVGSGNPQTLVWPKDRGAPVASAPLAALADIAALTYGSVFSGGVPTVFRPCAEGDGITACLAALALRRR